MKRFAFILLVFVLALSGCAAGRSAPSMEAEAPAMGGMPGLPEMGVSDGAAEEPGSPGPAAQVERLVIRNANLTIVVAEPGQAMTAISQMAESMGGYVVSQTLYKTNSRGGQQYPEANITVRVPAERLNEALAQIRGLVEDPVEDVLNENVTGQDVTKEYTDLNSRLTNLQEAEEQLREIMASANRTEDVLAVHQELTRIREQIEVIQGQIQYYRESADLSAITVLIRAEEAVQPLQVGGWRPAGVARDALQALIDTMQFLASAGIWLVIYALPVALVIFLPLRLLWWLIRRGRKNGKKAVQAPPAPPAA